MHHSPFRTPFLALFFGFLACFWGAMVQASPLSESVVRTSSLGAIADQSQAMLKAGIRDGLVQTVQVDPLVAETIAGVGSQAINAQEIRARLAADLDEDLETDQLEAVRDWYGSELGQRLVSAESAAASPGNWRTMRTNAPDLRQRFEGSPRQQLFKRFDEATQATATAVETTVEVQRGLADALESLRGANTTESLHAQVERYRPQIESMAREQVYLAFLSMYQSFSDQELEEYLQFLESPSGQAYADSASDAIHDAIVAPVDTIGQQLVRLLGTGSQ